jgi:hypothetical protein
LLFRFLGETGGFGACALLLGSKARFLLLLGGNARLLALSLDAGFFLLGRQPGSLLLGGEACLLLLLLRLTARLLLKGAPVGFTSGVGLGAGAAQHVGLVLGLSLRLGLLCLGLAALGGLGGATCALGLVLLGGLFGFLVCLCLLCLLRCARELVGERVRRVVVGGGRPGEWPGKRGGKRRHAGERYRCSSHSIPRKAIGGR